jgi:hypothetical protein
MTELPDFTEDGLLPPGDYVLTIEELLQSMLVLGPKDARNWDAPWRRYLVKNLGVLVGQLNQAGIWEVFVDGSFVEDKLHPNDIDGYFVCEKERFLTGELERELRTIDPAGIWTWDPASRRRFRGYPKPQLPMWHKYRVELYPEYGQESGIKDEFGHAVLFPSAFRRSRRDGRPRGVIRIGVRS